MKKVLFPILALVLALSLALPMATVVGAASGSETISSDTNTKVYYAGLDDNTYPVSPSSSISIPAGWNSNPLFDDSSWTNASFYKHSGYFTPNSAPYTTAFATGTQWISIAASGQGLDYSNSNGQRGVYLFRTTFNLPTGFTITSAKSGIGSDNYGWLYLNGNTVLSPGDQTQNDRNFLYPTDGPGPSTTTSIDPSWFVAGTNVVAVEVQNGVSINENGPIGVVFSLEVAYTYNNPPVANDDSYTTDEDTVLNVSAPGVLTNDTDPESDPLTATKVTDPSDGSVTLNADGSFTYTPDADYNGSDSFTYKANDGTADSNVATVTITVDPVNDPPVAVDDAYTTDEDTVLNVAASGVLGNDSDVDGDSLTAILDTDVSHGVLSLSSDGSFTYTPDQGYFGGLADGESLTDSFTYKANDGTADSNVATVTITVTGNNDPLLRASKSADTTMAILGETITYTIVVHNGGDCTLGVTVVDAMLGINDYFRLAKGDTKTYTIPYLVTSSDPEILKNTVTVSAIHSQGRVRPIERSWEVLTMAARTIGYWKTHPDDWADFGVTSMFDGGSHSTLGEYFPGLGAEVDGVNPLEMLRAQLIAAELNYMKFNGIFLYARYTAADITGTMRDAEAFLQRVYDSQGSNETLDDFWSNLNKKQQNNVKKIANPLKDILATFNEIGDWYWE